MDALGEQRAGLRVGAGVDQRQQLRNRRARAGGSIAVTSSHARNTSTAIGEYARAWRGMPRGTRPPMRTTAQEPESCASTDEALSHEALWVCGCPPRRSLASSALDWGGRWV